MTQHAKIIELCFNRDWVCQNEFRALYIFSPHKRRVEIEGRKNRYERPTGRYIFEDRPCIHGFKGQSDYRMKENPDYTPLLKTKLTDEEIMSNPERLREHILGIR